MSDQPDRDPARTFVQEGDAFYAQHVADLGHTAATWGGLTWGLLRALAECPDCPGVFRYALDDEWRFWRCPRCGGMWEWKHADSGAAADESTGKTGKARKGKRGHAPRA